MNRRLTYTVLATLNVATLVLSLSVAAKAQGTRFEWVIGSEASALAVNGAKITLTGSGTFVLGQPEKVCGGGTWKTFSSDTTMPAGSGEYRVTDLVRFELGPGAISDPTIHAGLAQLRIRFSDGTGGILTVSCMLPGSPASVAEGISASKEFTDYFQILVRLRFSNLRIET